MSQIQTTIDALRVLETIHPITGQVLLTAADMIEHAEWIIANAEPAPDIYVDPARRGHWREARENWLTGQVSAGNLKTQT
jgi:hypothetical protein